MRLWPIALGALSAEPAGVLSSVEVIKGQDGNDIALHIHRPEGPLPGILHIHGGGMAFVSAAKPVYTHWRQSLAATGLVVAGVEFRNSAGALGPIRSLPD